LAIAKFTGENPVINVNIVAVAIIPKKLDFVLGKWGCLTGLNLKSERD
jgi:hypothetical protein